MWVQAGEDSNRRATRAAPRALLTLSCALLVSGCALAPPVERTAEHGVVRAADAAHAERLGALLDDLAPRIDALLPGIRGRPTEVWLADFEQDADLAGRPAVLGVAAPDMGRVRIRADLSEDRLAYVLVHELVHAQIDDSWAPLPAVMKEGLCDAVAFRLVPEEVDYIRARRMFDASFAFDDHLGLEVLYFEPSLGRRRAFTIPITASSIERRSPTEALALSGRGMHLHDDFRDGDALYGYGLLLVERIVARHDFAGLHQLCTTASERGLPLVPEAWLLAAADLDGDDASWAAALRDAIDHPALAAQCDYAEGQLTAYIVGQLRFRFPDFEADDFLDRALPTIGWTGSAVRIGLGDVEPLRRRVEESWAQTRPVSLPVGRGWWYRDALGVHLTTVTAPEPGNPWYVINRVRAGDDGTFSLGLIHDPGSSLPADVTVEAQIRLGVDESGTWIVSTLPGGFASFRVELDGRVVAGLDLDGTVSRLPATGAGAMSTVAAQIPEIATLAKLRVYAREARLVISQSGRQDLATGEQRFPIGVPLER